MNYKAILKKQGVSITDFSNKLGLSRTTIYSMFEKYSKGIGLDEPYQGIFDAFFLAERNKMKGNYESRNGNLIVTIVENTAENANGTFIKGSETRGKRDIVMARVRIGDSNVQEGAMIYFSYYAAQPFTLEGEQVYVINKQDIKFIRKDN